MKTTVFFLILFLFFGAKVTSQKVKNTKQVIVTSDIVCGDILYWYAEKHPKLEFVKCTKIKDSQVIVEALYRVKGSDIDIIETHFSKHYHTSQLKYICCGWETSSYGYFKNTTLEEKGFSNIISIYSGETLETAKKEVPYFYVKVSIALI